MTKERKIKVLHIISGYGGGISSHIRNLAKEINSDKITFDVIGFSDYSDEFAEEIASTDGKVFTFLKPKKYGFLKFFINGVSTIKKNGPYDYVQCHISGYLSIVFRLMTLLAGQRKMIVHAHKSQNDFMEGFKNKMITLADRIGTNISATSRTSCSTEASKFVFGDKFIDNKKIMHIPNSIPPEKYMLEYTEEQKIAMKEKLEIDINKTIFGNVGRFYHQKNHMFMVEIVEELVKLEIEFLWIFVGEGDLESKIKDEINDRNLSEYVKFLGRREDAHELYQIFDVFVMPSFYEGLPTVIVEAQAAGVPCVLSDSITKEVDLKLGMVEYISLDKHASYWATKVKEISNLSIPASEERLKHLTDNGFTNKVASKLYEDFLFKKIESYSIGDEISD